MKKSGHHAEIPRFQKHNGAPALSQLPKTMVKPVGNAPGRHSLDYSRRSSTIHSVAGSHGGRKVRE
jgi:hypothetical protein